MISKTPALLLTLALIAVHTTTAEARRYTGSEDLTQVWRQYALEDADAQPGASYPFAECFRRAAIVNEVPETLLLAVARGESDFNPTARSHANAHGVMQILWPSTARHLGLHLLSELYDPCKNIDAGARYLKELMEKYHGDVHLVLAAYNYGPARIPINADIPNGAEWYSGYIYHHMKFILGKRIPAGAPAHNYADHGKLDLIEFSEPYRAAAFVAALEQSLGDLQIDWFRSGQAKYKVVLHYADSGELAKGRARLARAGFAVDQ